MRVLKSFYLPLFAFGLRRKRLAVAIGRGVVLASLIGGSLLGREFMPKLEEGNFWIRATLPTSISLEQSAKYVGRMRSLILGCPAQGECDAAHRSRPEITTVVSQLGPPRRRHRRVGVLQHRALRAAAAVRRVAARRHQGEDDRRAVARAAGRVPGRDLQLLADDLRQRRGGDVGRQGREHRQGRRPRPARQRGEGATRSSTSWRRSAASRTWACSRRWASRTSASRPTACSAAATA